MRTALGPRLVTSNARPDRIRTAARVGGSWISRLPARHCLAPNSGGGSEPARICRGGPARPDCKSIWTMFGRRSGQRLDLHRSRVVSLATKPWITLRRHATSMTHRHGRSGPSTSHGGGLRASRTSSERPPSSCRPRWLKVVGVGASGGRRVVTILPAFPFISGRSRVPREVAGKILATSRISRAAGRPREPNRPSRAVVDRPRIALIVPFEPPESASPLVTSEKTRSAVLSLTGFSWADICVTACPHRNPSWISLQTSSGSPGQPGCDKAALAIQGGEGMEERGRMGVYL